MKYLLIFILCLMGLSCTPCCEEVPQANNNSIPHKAELKRYAELLEKTGQKNRMLSWITSEDFDPEELKEISQYITREDSLFKLTLHWFDAPELNIHPNPKDQIRVIFENYYRGFAAFMSLTCEEESCSLNSKTIRRVYTGNKGPNGLKEFNLQRDSIEQCINKKYFIKAFEKLEKCSFWYIRENVDRNPTGCHPDTWTIEAANPMYPYKRLTWSMPGESFLQACEYVVSLVDPKMNLNEYMRIEKPATNE